MRQGSKDESELQPRIVSLLLTRLCRENSRFAARQTSTIPAHQPFRGCGCRLSRRAVKDAAAPYRKRPLTAMSFVLNDLKLLLAGEGVVFVFEPVV